MHSRSSRSLRSGLSLNNCSLGRALCQLACGVVAALWSHESRDSHGAGARLHACMRNVCMLPLLHTRMRFRQMCAGCVRGEGGGEGGCFRSLTKDAAGSDIRSGMSVWAICAAGLSAIMANSG